VFYGDRGYCVAWAGCKKAQALGRNSVSENRESRAEEGGGAGGGGVPHVVGLSVEPCERGGSGMPPEHPEVGARRRRPKRSSRTGSPMTSLTPIWRHYDAMVSGGWPEAPRSIGR
jgi:hypothetical protein